LYHSKNNNKYHKNQSYSQIFSSYDNNNKWHKYNHPQNIEDKIIYHIFVWSC
jgi:hypothetical protein